MVNKNFHQALKKAEIANIDYPLQGVNVLLPNGKAMLSKLEKIIFSNYETKGYLDVGLPSTIPSEFVAHLNPKGLMKAENEYRSFFLAPSGEVQSILVLSELVHAQKDLPLKLISKTIAFRENDPSALIKDIEFFSYELNGFFASQEEAEAEEIEVKSVFKNIIDKLGIPTIEVRQQPDNGPYVMVGFFPFSDSFGSLYWSFVLGTKYTDRIVEISRKKGIKPSPIQLNVGITSRVLSAYLSNHINDKGFILSRELSPYDAMVPRLKDQDDKNKLVIDEISKNGITYKLTNAVKRNEAFEKFYALGAPLLIAAGRNQVQIASRTGQPVWVNYESVGTTAFGILNSQNETRGPEIVIVDAEDIPKESAPYVFKVNTKDEQKFTSKMKKLGYFDKDHAAFVFKKY